MSELFDPGFLSRIQKLVLSMGITVSGSMSGNRKSRSKGMSVEFSDFREYTEGDDFRRIDWNAYGRFEKLFVKLFMEEKEAPVSIFLDTSSSMNWGMPNKSYSSRRLAAALSFMALSNYDRLSLYCITDCNASSLVSLRGTHAFHSILNLLENVKYDGTTDIKKGIENSSIKANRGITIIISDFFSTGSVMDTIKYLKYYKQDVYICHTLSPQELSPDLNSGCRVVDCETGRYKDLVVSKELLKAYGKALKYFVEKMESDCFSQSASYVLFDTSFDVEQIIKKVVGA